MKLNVDGKTYDIVIERKSTTRNTYIRVKPDLTILVTTNKFTTTKTITNLIEENYEKLIKMIDVQEKKKENNESLKRSILFVSAITIHNIPEGMAIGVAFGSIASSGASMNVVGALMLALGIGIQNFPEGAAVSLPLRREGYSRFRSFMIGQASAIVEPIAALIGVILAMSIKSILPILLSFASGAMIVVVARELLPESVKENKNLSTIGLIGGFVLMMILDVALG